MIRGTICLEVKLDTRHWFSLLADHIKLLITNTLPLISNTARLTWFYLGNLDFLIRLISHTTFFKKSLSKTCFKTNLWPNLKNLSGGLNMVGST